MVPLISPTSCLIKLSCSAIFSKFLKDYLSGNPLKTLLKSREMMFIGSAWSAKSVACQGAPPIDSRVSVPSAWGTDALGGRKSLPPPPAPILDPGHEPRMRPVWE